MKASELRLGNLITSDGEIFTVDEIRNDFVSAGALGIYPAGFDCDLGIPLTEEWLRKFVFKVTAGYFRKAPAHLSLYQSINNMWVDEGTDAKCEYVHQLQNLYFALTGNELMMEGKDKVQNEWVKEHGQQTQ